MKGIFKLRLFYGFISSLVISILLMVILIAIGADGLGEFMMWVGVAISLIFMAIASFLSKD